MYLVSWPMYAEMSTLLICLRLHLQVYQTAMIQSRLSAYDPSKKVHLQVYQTAMIQSTLSAYDPSKKVMLHAYHPCFESGRRGVFHVYRQCCNYWGKWRDSIDNGTIVNPMRVEREGDLCFRRIGMAGVEF
jgi:hypothetical protein